MLKIFNSNRHGPYVSTKRLWEVNVRGGFDNYLIIFINSYYLMTHKVLSQLKLRSGIRLANQLLTVKADFKRSKD